MKVLTLPNSQDSITVYTSDGSAEVMLLGKDIGVGGSSPIPTVLVVDPNGAPSVQDGAFSGASTFTTLQAAYNALPANATATIWLAGGNVGSLTTVFGLAQSLTIRGFGGKTDVSHASVISGITLAPDTTSIELVDLIVSGGLQSIPEAAPFTGITRLRNATVIGNISLHRSPLFVAARSDLQGASIQCDSFTASDLVPGGSGQTISPDSAVVTLDGPSEFAFFSGGPGPSGAHQFSPTGTIVNRSDDAASAATVGTDGALNITDNLGRVICQPGTLSAPATWTITHTDAPLAGVVVDVWTQAFALTIVFSATTLAVVAGNSAPQRLFFFAPASGAFALTGQQYLLLPSGGSPPSTPTLTAPGSIAVYNTVSTTVSATSTDSDLTRMDWVLDPGGGEVVVATDLTAPYSTLWTPTGITPGDHTIVARAVRGAFHTDSLPVTINVGTLIHTLFTSVNTLVAYYGDFGVHDAGGGNCDSWTDQKNGNTAVAAGPARAVIATDGKHTVLRGNGDAANTTCQRDGALDLPAPSVSTPTFYYAVFKHRAWTSTLTAGSVCSAGTTGLMRVGDLTSTPNMAATHNVDGPLNNGAPVGSLVRMKTFWSNTTSDFLQLASVVTSGVACGPTNPAAGLNILSSVSGPGGALAGDVYLLIVTDGLPTTPELNAADSACVGMFPGLAT